MDKSDFVLSVFKLHEVPYGFVDIPFNCRQYITKVISDRYRSGVIIFMNIKDFLSLNKKKYFFNIIFFF